ncbi:MAG: two-component regulator propeller domain-containing protein [Niabella sp.]
MSYLSITVLTLLVNQAFIFCQSYSFRHFYVENGLSNSTVNCITQDRKGFMWFGTKDGLNRFDGYNFKIFRNDPTVKESIGCNYINQLYEDSNGVLWVGTARGLYCFNSLSESFKMITGTSEANIRNIIEDKEKNIWFIENYRLYQYIPYKKVIKEFVHPDLNLYTSICNIDNKQLAMSTGNGYIAIYNFDTKKIRISNIFTKSGQPVSQWIEKIFYTQEGSLLLGTSSQGLKKFNLSDNSYEDILTYNEDGSDIFVRDIIKSNTHEYWVAGESGIFIYNEGANKYTHLKKNIGDPYSLSDNAVYSIFKDKEGGIWVGTYFGGVNYTPKQSMVFDKFFQKTAFEKGNIAGNVVRGIVQDKYNKIWIGTEDAGLNKYDPLTGKFTNFRPDNTANTIAYTNIHGLLISNDTLWIGTFEHGLDIMNVRTGKVLKHFDTKNSNLTNNFIYTITKLRNDKIIIATASGIYYFCSGKGDFYKIDPFPENTFYTDVCEDDSGNIWAGSYNGNIYFFNPGNGASGSFKIIKNNTDILKQTRITKLFEDADKMLWIATEAGLYKYNYFTKTIIEFNTKNGIPQSMIYNILQDNNKNYWITTSKGLIRLDAKLNNTKLFTTADGLLNNQFNYNSGFIDNAGIIYIGSIKGLISFNPNSYVASDYNPPLFFTGVSIMGKDVPINPNSPLKQSIITTDHVVLTYKESIFNINLAALNFSSPENIEYAYKMEGLNKTWNILNNSRSVYFTNIPPGEYILYARSTNNDGKWMNNERKLFITVLAPWWKTNIAYFIYIIFIITCIVFVIAFYRNYLLNKQKQTIQLFTISKERELLSSQIDFFTKIAHEIRTPLTLIKAPLERLLRSALKTPQNEKHLNMMHKNTERLLSLTQELLSFRKIESKQLALRIAEQNIVNIVQEIYDDYTEIAEQKNIRFSIKTSATQIWAYIDKEAFTKIITNMLDNAFKYGKRLVTLDIRLSEHLKNYIIEFKNDGAAIPEETKEKVFQMFFRSTDSTTISGSGIGLALARSLAALHNGTLQLIDDNFFTIFRLTMPVMPTEANKNEYIGNS